MAHMKTMKTPPEPVTIERLERALVVTAHLMQRHGRVMVPIFEKLEREIVIMRADQMRWAALSGCSNPTGPPGGMKAPRLIEVDSRNSCAPSLMGESA
jgi:hypothetical protein